MLLLGQVIGYTPSVLADEEQPTVATEQLTTVNSLNQSQLVDPETVLF